MKNLTKIEPEPIHRDCDDDLKWIGEEERNGLYDYQCAELIRLLIHKVNELTGEVNKLKSHNNLKTIDDIAFPD